MARYCTNCGRELKEGEVCSCQRQDEMVQDVSAGSQEPEQIQEGSSEEIHGSSEEYLQKESLQDEGKTVAYQADSYQQREPQGSCQQGNYQPREPQGSYQQGSYQQRGVQGGYQQREPQGSYQSGGYQQRDFQGGYQQRDSQKGYQPREPQGSYQQKDQQREYQQRDFQGGYQQRGAQGGYQQGGYQQRGTQGGYQQGGYQQRGPQGGYQQNGYQNQSGMNGQWFSERKDNLVRHTKNIFAQIPKLICRPDTTMGDIAKQNSSILGIEMISFQAVVMLVILMIGNFYLHSLTRGYFSFNPLLIIVFVLVMTFAVAYLEAGILTGITFAFKGKTSIHRMLCAVGYKALIQGMMLIVAALFLFISWQAALILYMIGSMAAQLFFIDGYRCAVEIHKDRRLYAFLIGEILFFIAMVIILNFILTSVVTSMVGNYLDSYGGLVKGLLRELY